MLHSWGNNQTEAFEQIAMAMFNYMTTNYDSVDTSQRFEIEADGHDMMSLLFHFLDEWLFAFSADPFFIPRVNLRWLMKKSCIFFAYRFIGS
ncbi:unnamed protein product [Schistosoma bovis]|nr:unnamed protein product [Schistosoma bovis]